MYHSFKLDIFPFTLPAVFWYKAGVVAALCALKLAAELLLSLSGVTTKTARWTTE